MKFRRWFWITKGGINTYEVGFWRTFPVKEGLAGNYVQALTKDKNGNIWAAWVHGLSYFNGTVWTDVTPDKASMDINVKAVRADERNNLWIGILSGTGKFDGTKWSFYSKKDGLVDNTVNAIATDGQDNCWFGTNSGLSYFQASNK
jgi:ligand-binding sensor domain-containing protein